MFPETRLDADAVRVNLERAERAGILALREQAAAHHTGFRYGEHSIRGYVGAHVDHLLVVPRILTSPSYLVPICHRKRVSTSSDADSAARVGNRRTTEHHRLVLVRLHGAPLCTHEVVAELLAVPAALREFRGQFA